MYEDPVGAFGTLIALFFFLVIVFGIFFSIVDEVIGWLRAKRKKVEQDEKGEGK